ncbi:hypothetical protein V1512DRAFT_255822 [Lipomyces arxii]|uniref:uncharacterized protein n=1 Tax=Lipomyces arxii TaxID=56418 RepID=UPI0034CF7371
MASYLEIYFNSVQTSASTKDSIQITNVLSSHGKILNLAMEDQRQHRQRYNAVALAAEKVRDSTWREIAVSCWNVAYSIHISLDIIDAYREQCKVAQLINRIAEKSDRWILSLMFTVIQDLRSIAMQADKYIKTRADSVETANKLEEAARIVNRALTICLNDRNSVLEDSRKWGVYFIISVLFKIYFTLGTISLATSLLRVLNASSNSGDMPPLENYPKSHVVTFQYYVGVLAFMEEDYQKAEENLTAALEKCHMQSKYNQEMILLYLLPTHLLLHRKLPNQSIWKIYPKLREYYQQLFVAAKRGDLKSFEITLASLEKVLIKKRLYLTMLKVRTKIVRPRLFELVYKALDSNSRVPVSAFRKGLEFVGIEVDEDQIECWAAVMIYQGQMKGYISRERKIIVLSNSDAFPR